MRRKKEEFSLEEKVIVPKKNLREDKTF